MLNIKIRRNNNNEDVSVKIPIIDQNNLSGSEVEIDRFIDDETNASINVVQDSEKFIYTNPSIQGLSFQFYNSITETYSATLLNQSFNESEINSGADYVKNSFYIAQYYDTNDLDSQNLLHNSYLNGFTFFPNGANSSYNNTILINSEFMDVLLEKQFVDQQTDIFSIYVRYYFFNSKTGRLVPMLALDNENDVQSSRLFYRVEVNKTTRTFTIRSEDFFTVRMKEIVDISYTQKIDNSLDVNPSEKQNPPLGDGFTNEGNYLTFE